MYLEKEKKVTKYHYIDLSGFVGVISQLIDYYLTLVAGAAVAPSWGRGHCATPPIMELTSS